MSKDKLDALLQMAAANVAKLLPPEGADPDDEPPPGASNTRPAILPRKNFLTIETAEELAAKWLHSYDAGVLTFEDILKNHFRIMVPYLLAPRVDCNCLQMKTDEQLEESKLFEPLARFLSNNEDPTSFFKSLSGMDKPESFCGHVFSLGEPTYACRDCGLDPTCVLCVDCFKVSGHQKHRYKISNSAGGGYCDCGDSEAWKRHVYCDIHFARITDESESRLPEDVRARAKTLFDIIIPYCYDRLTEPFRNLLPDFLRIEEFEFAHFDMKSFDEVFCTILYNDESHTFENVIQTLTRALGCTKKDAIEFASYIDREGRSIIRCADFSECNKLNDLIDRQSTRNGGKPLAVTVVPTINVAHELFATKLLTWVQKIVAHSCGYREAFYEIMVMVSEDYAMRRRREFSLLSNELINQKQHQEKIPNISLLEGVMLNDTGYWKSARVVWHHLFATGLLKDYKTKKKFAGLFTKHYVEIMKDFIADDHDHAFSISSLSVQIFTVPTIAHYLIEKGDAFYALLRSFVHECEIRKNATGRLQFERNATSGPFRRTSFSTLDLKYLLTTPPTVEEWDSEDFKRHFLHGFSDLVRLLTWMQEMDAAIRQTGTHMEYEAEWETAFNIFIKLAPVLSLAVEWCATKKSILIRAYRCVLTEFAALYEKDNPFQLSKLKSVEYAGHQVMAYQYDVATKPTSIHLPLSRVWAALHLHLSAYDLDYFSSEFNVTNKPSPEALIEPTLRGQALSAQVQVGMWKRNGYSILNQLFFYRNVRCRTDMFDKDILALQVGAVTIETNEFLIHVLNRFDLLNYLKDVNIPSSSAEDPQSYSFYLLEEFLELMICVVSGRYVPGIGRVNSEGCLKKEIIQLLCVKPMTHSVLNKSMVENLNYETGCEQVLGDVATAKKQTGGLLYELNEDLYSEYDVFFYHYNREQMSHAENRQLLLKKEKNLPEFFPPPHLPSFTVRYEPVANILKSDVLLSIFVVVLKRCLAKPKPTSGMVGMDSQLRRLFHLIGYGLNEELIRSDFRDKYPFRFCMAANKKNIFDLLKECGQSPNMVQHHQMIRWILSHDSLARSQVSPMDSLPASGSDRIDPDEEELINRKKRAAEAKQKMLARMSAAQSEFRAINADLFHPDPSTEETMIVEEEEEQPRIVLGPNQSRFSSGNEVYTCILCQESQILTEISGLTLPIFVQRSTVMCQDRSKLKDAWRSKRDNKHLWRRNALLLHSDLLFAPHISCCGHVMHSTCWQRHFETVLIKERRRPYRLRHLQTFDVEKNEYLCPMCQCLCNAVMPMVASSNEFFSPLEPYQYRKDDPLPTEPIYDPTYEDWFKMCNTITTVSGPVLDEFLPTEDVYKQFCRDGIIDLQGPKAEGSRPDINMWKTPSLGKVIASLPENEKNAFYYFFPKGGRGLLRDEMMEITTLFIHSIFTKGLGGRAGNDGEFRFPALTWQSIAFTIINTETVHRDQNLPFFGSEVAVRQAAAMNYSVLSGSLVSVYCQLYDTPSFTSTALVRLESLVSCLRGAMDILKLDAFALLVSLTYTMPALFLDDHHRRPLRLGNLEDFYLLRATTLMHLLQVVLTTDIERIIGPSPDDNRSGNSVYGPQSSLALACVRIWGNNRKPISSLIDTIDWTTVAETVSQAMIPFLRCCSKFFECLTGIPTPKCFAVTQSNFEDLVKYLGLPQDLNAYCDDYLRIDLIAMRMPSPLEFREIMRGPPRHPMRIALTFLDVDDDNVPSWKAFSYPRNFPKLIDLPEDYAELLNAASDFACRTCGTHECRIPTLCLLCGETLCSQSYCCQDDLKGAMVGACTYHSHFCGGTVGIFLRIRECKVFFLAGRGKGCFVSPPYLDEYGETDQGLRRGNPMKLCREKYEEFRRSWIFHKIHDDIAANTEQIPTIVATEWQYL